MTQVSCKTTINVPADVWPMISHSGAAGQYLAGVVSCTVEGAGGGTLRPLTSTDGTSRSSSAWKRWTRRPGG